ncbi:MAG: substrate-binding domain-containing protein [Myxococcales bacterium]|nr:substrate-binding domain-containing protein [Myxococcales bacterium]
MHERTRSAPKRLTGAGPTPSIGLLVDLLDDSPYQWAILQGAMDAAHDRGAHLLCFAGGVLGAPAGESGERNGVFDLAKQRNVDGLILLSGSIGKRIGPAKLEEFAHRYRPLPMCSIGVALNGMSSVCVDNDAGMRSMIEHLTQDHQARRIAFVRGPEGNAEAEQRFRIYVDTLARSGLPYTPELVASGDFETESGRRAVAMLLDDRKIALDQIDAVVAANDLMALGVLEELGRRNLRVPGDVAVVGFDDVDESRVSLPPLTTVRQPLYEQGRDAVRLVCDQMHNGAPPELQARDTELVARRSCGCLPGRPVSLRLSEAPPVRHGFEAALLGRRQAVLTEMARAARGLLGAAGVGWEERLLNAFADQLRGQSPDAFILGYDALLRKLSDHDVDVAICNDVISAMRGRMMRLFVNDGQRRLQAENVFHEARVMTAHVIDRVQSWRRVRAWRGARALGRAAALIAAGADMESLAQAARENLPALGIPRCFLAEHCGRSGDVRLARLVLSFGPESRTADAALSRPIPINEILRSQVLPSSGEHAFAVMPITSREKDIGVLVLELAANDGYLYETLREVFAAALTGRRYSA